MLDKKGNNLREPYSKAIDDGIFELRCKFGSDITRILYFFYDGRKIILTNGFVKKTQKLPSKELVLAKNTEKITWNEVERMSEFQDFLQGQLKDEDFRREYENIQPEMDVIRAIADARISQNLTQKELAAKTGINRCNKS